ncbi:MAG: LysR substrate-binding domain-containing protein [Pseudomonadota bacterium]
MRPTLRQLQYFVAIADNGKMGDAARSLGVSQPSLSSQVAEVEAELGVSLVERGRHGAHLTPVGQEFVRRARDILRDVEALKTVTRREPGELISHIKLGVIPSVGPYLLPSVTRHLHTRFPKLRLSVREERSIDLERSLRDARLDTVISTQEDHRDAEALPLLEEQFWACGAQDSGLGDPGAPLPLEQLAGQTLLTLEYGHQMSSVIQNLAAQANARVGSEYEGTSLDAIRQMAAMGAGIAILPSLYALHEASRDGSLVLRPIQHPLARRTISLVWRPSSPIKSDFHLLAQNIRGVAEGLMKDQDRI